jgi:hypothetical protein
MERLSGSVKVPAHFVKDRRDSPTWTAAACCRFGAGSLLPNHGLQARCTSERLSTAGCGAESCSGLQQSKGSGIANSIHKTVGINRREKWAEAHATQERMASDTLTQKGPDGKPFRRGEEKISLAAPPRGDGHQVYLIEIFDIRRRTSPIVTSAKTATDFGSRIAT